MWYLLRLFTTHLFFYYTFVFYYTRSLLAFLQHYTLGLQASFERDDSNGAFEAQYKKLLDKVKAIYDNAKEFHGKVGVYL